MASIQGVYVALFGRPADPAGLAYFNSVTQNGANLGAIGDLSSTQEYKDRFANQSNVQIVTAIYQSLFNRDPEATGLNFFVNALNNKTLTINNIAIAILDGAQGTDKTIVDTKIASANLFTAAIDTPVEVGSYVGNAAAASGRAFLAPITTTVATQAQADAAVATVVANGAAGNTFALTAGTDTIVVGNIGAGLVNTTNSNDTINGGANFNAAADTIDGGLGIDTFNFNVAGAVAPAANVIKNVEILNITATANGSFAATNVAGITQLWNVNSGAFNFAATDVALTTTVGLKGTIGGTTGFAFKDASGTADSASLAVDTATVAGAVTVADIETLNISNTGTSSVSALNAAAAKAVNVSGSGAFTLGLTSTVAETVSATGLTGAFTFNGSNQANLKSVVGGNGNDFITVDTNSTNTLSVNGGTGSDTITLVNAGAASKAISLSGGAGADIFQIGTGGVAVANVNATDLASVNNSLVTITDFNKAEDAIKLDVAGAARDTLLVAELQQIAGAADLKAAAELAATYTTAGQFSVFNFGSDAYIFNNVGAGFGANDGLIKIVGITAADLTVANFQVA